MAQKPAAIDEIKRVLGDTPQTIGDASQLGETLEAIRALDEAFEARGGKFFHPGKDPFDTSEKFSRIHIEDYRQVGRPSMAAVAVHHAQLLGIDPASPEYKAMMLVALRAEMKTSSLTSQFLAGSEEPDYHSRNHYIDVAVMTASLLKKNVEIGKTVLSKKDQAITFITAIGHDIDHQGRGNPAENLTLNEETSFAAMKPLLEAAGLSAPDIAQIHTILMTTSPNGPHAVLKAVAHAQRDGRTPDMAMIDPQNKFPELHILAQDKKLTQMAAIVSDSDLYGSSGAGLQTNMLLSALLTAESRKVGGKFDMTTDSARKYFLDNILGAEGFSSDAGREVGNKSVEALRAETARRLAASNIAPKPPSQ